MGSISFLFREVSLHHGTYVRWKLRTSCAGMKKNRSFPRKKIGFDLSVDLTKCPQQIVIPDLLHMCATCSGLPSNISTMAFTCRNFVAIWSTDLPTSSNIHFIYPVTSIFSFKALNLTFSSLIYTGIILERVFRIGQRERRKASKITI